MSGGRTPKPEYLRVVDKAHAYRYKNEPKPLDSRPVAPSCLSERGIEIFNEFVERVEEIGVASATDTEAIVLYSKNQEELEYLERFLIENGHSYCTEGASGSQYRKYPEAEIYNQCKTLKLRILNDFGLTPVSRGRVKVKKPETKAQNPFAALDEVEEAEG